MMTITHIVPKVKPMKGAAKALPLMRFESMAPDVGFDDGASYKKGKCFSWCKSQQDRVYMYRAYRDRFKHNGSFPRTNTLTAQT